MPRYIYQPRSSSGPMQKIGVGIVEQGQAYDLTEAEAVNVEHDPDFALVPNEAAGPTDAERQAAIDADAAAAQARIDEAAALERARLADIAAGENPNPSVATGPANE